MVAGCNIIGMTVNRTAEKHFPFMAIRLRLLIGTRICPECFKLSFPKDNRVCLEFKVSKVDQRGIVLQPFHVWASYIP